MGDETVKDAQTVNPAADASGTDKAVAKAGFLDYVNEQLKTATGKAKEGYEFILANAEKVDINKDGKADLTQIKGLAKQAGGTISEGVDIAGKKLGEAGRAIYEVAAPVVEQAAEFGKDNMTGLIVGGLALLAGLMGGLGMIGSLLLGLLAFAVGGMLGDKDGLLKGPGDWLKGKFGKSPAVPERGQDQGAGVPEAGQTAGQEVPLTPAARELAEISQNGPKVDIAQKGQDVTIVYKTVEEGRLSTVTAKGKLVKDGEEHLIQDVHVKVITGTNTEEFAGNAFALPVDDRGNIKVEEAKTVILEAMKPQSNTRQGVEVTTGTTVNPTATRVATGQEATTGVGGP